MLCPEVWDFKAPQHFFSTGVNLLKESPSISKNHYFNHSVSVVFPEAINVPKEIQSSLVDDKDYYKIHALHPHELVNKEFVEAFVKKGELSLLAVDRKIDVHDSLAIIPSEGYLILSLTQSTYQTLGLEGKPSFYDRKNQSTRYVVTLDLKKECFTPGKKNYERVRNCLQDNFKNTFDVIVFWDPPGENQCPSSIASWFHNRGYKVSLCRQDLIKRTNISVNVPVVDDSCEYDKFFEWLGIFSINGDLASSEDPDKCDYQITNLPFFKASRVQYIQCTGFFTRRMINRVYSAMKNYASKTNFQWFSMDVQGFADSPVSWGLKEHTFYTDGDNSYTFVFRPNGKCITRKSLSSNNQPRIFQ